VRRVLAVLALIVFSGSAVAGELPPVVRRPIILQLEGFFAADRASAQLRGADAVLVRVASSERWFSAVRARTVGGDQPLDGRDVLARLAPIQPNLNAVGARDLCERLAGATDGTPVAIEGLIDLGSHSYLLRSVGVGDATPPP